MERQKEDYNRGKNKKVFSKTYWEIDGNLQICIKIKKKRVFYTYWSSYLKNDNTVKHITTQEHKGSVNTKKRQATLTSWLQKASSLILKKQTTGTKNFFGSFLWWNTIPSQPFQPPCEFCEISKNTFSYRIPLVAASGLAFLRQRSGVLKKKIFCKSSLWTVNNNSIKLFGISWYGLAVYLLGTPYKYTYHFPLDAGRKLDVHNSKGFSGFFIRDFKCAYKDISLCQRA